MNLVLASHTISELLPLEAVRISDYLVGKMKALPSRKSVKKAIQKGSIYLNKELASTGRFVKQGDLIEWVQLEVTPAKIYYKDVPVLFEDEHIAVMQKPAGIPVSGNCFNTLLNALGHNLTIDPKDNYYPQPAHRLDTGTSGIVLVGKNRKSRIAFGDQFSAQLIRKKYCAVVYGATAKSGTIYLPIDGKKAASSFNTLEQVNSLKSGKLSLIELYPTTGRTHQLRKHCLAMGHPIVGDPLYQLPGRGIVNKGMFLCARGIEFEHPTTKERMVFDIGIPNKFLKLLKYESRKALG